MKLDKYQNSKILIVDDEPANTLLLKYFLKQEGFKNLWVVQDSRKVLGLCEEIKPDLILLDLNMPHINGIEILQRMRQDKSNEFAPVLVLTALTDTEIRLQALKLGAKDFLSKPFDLSEVIVRIRNLLEVRLLNKEIMIQNRLLEEKVAQRTEVLKRAANELKEFAYIASHDLQEPLRKIIAFGDRLAEKFSTELTEEGVDYLLRMQRSALRMQGLIEDLLKFSRLTTCAREFERVDLNNVIAEVLSDLELKIEDTGARIEADALPDISAEKTQMRQLFQNLIGNALTYHREEVPPEINIRNLGKVNELNLISVEDNGIGIDEKSHSKIFKPFERLHNKSDCEGYGMGLAICHKIVEFHSGKIEVRSNSKGGTSFIIALPVCKSIS